MEIAGVYYGNELIELIADYIDKIRGVYNINDDHSINIDSVTQYGESDIYRIYITISPSKYLRKHIIENNKDNFESYIKAIYDIVKNKYNLIDVDVHAIGKRDYIMIILNPRLTDFLLYERTFDKLMDLNENNYDKSLFMGIDLSTYISLLNSNYYDLEQNCKTEINKEICKSDYFNLKYYKKHKNDPIVSLSKNVPGQILSGKIEGIPINGIITKINEYKKIAHITDYDISRMPSPTPLTLEILDNYSIPFKQYKDGYQQVEYNKKTGRYNKFNIGNVYNFA